jgi:murein L,D-transpeptidase YcbB/YkuD
MRRPVLTAALAMTLAVPADVAARNDSFPEIIDSGHHPRLNRPDFSGYRGEVIAAYEANAFQPLWLAAGVPTSQADAVVEAIASAGSTGLLPADYDARWLDSERTRLHAAAEDSAAFDTGLTISLLRFVADSYRGRVEPRRAGFQFDPPPKDLDLASIVGELARSPAPAERLHDFEPPFPLYHRLRNSLAPLRRLASEVELPELPELPTLRPGDRAPGVPVVRQILALLGYIGFEAPRTGESDLYDNELAEALARFQRRHGLDSDGVLGRQTRRQLDVPLRHRVRQIELAMERLRWLPHQFGERFVFVNIPEFRLRGYAARDQAPAISMGVVVGSAARRHETPVLLADMQYVVFRPYWYVPRSITRNEIVPNIREDPSYVTRNNYEIVSGHGPRADRFAADETAIGELDLGALRLRQAPGPNNALGLVKFIFPNPSHVYLHDTPSKALFRRSRRDFSHGCIRVESPVALARFVLGPEWTEARVTEAMKGRDNRQVNLPAPVPVVLYYTTAVVEEDGELFFFDDIYGHDARLARLLSAGYRASR